MTEKEALNKWASERGISREVDEVNWKAVKEARAKKTTSQKARKEADEQAQV